MRANFAAHMRAGDGEWHAVLFAAPGPDGEMTYVELQPEIEKYGKDTTLALLTPQPSRNTGGTWAAGNGCRRSPTAGACGLCRTRSTANRARC